MGDLDKDSISELSTNISYMNDSTLFESIQNIEKLYMKLMIEYSYELQRSQALGIFTKSQEENKKARGAHMGPNRRADGRAGGRVAGRSGRTGDQLLHGAIQCYVYMIADEKKPLPRRNT